MNFMPGMPLPSAREWEYVLVCQNVGRICQGRAYVIPLQTRVFAQDIGLGCALGKHPNKKFYRDAGTSNHWFASHDSRINDYALNDLLIHWCSSPSIIVATRSLYHFLSYDTRGKRSPA